MKIYKELLPPDTLLDTFVELPFDSAREAKKCIVKLDCQHAMPCMWYQADMNEGHEKHKFAIFALGTGHEVNDGSLTLEDNYIGSIQLFNGRIVLHYFIQRIDNKKIVDKVDKEG